MNDWLDVMLEEIARKQREAEQARREQEQREQQEQPRQPPGDQSK